MEERVRLPEYLECVSWEVARMIRYLELVYWGRVILDEVICGEVLCGKIEQGKSTCHHSGRWMSFCSDLAL